MPARPRIPDPQEGPLQEFAYALRELGEGKASVGWIADHDETTVSRAALYAALSGTRLPTRETVSTLLRWWAGDPTIEQPEEEEAYFTKLPWAWIGRLPQDHEKRRFANEWRTRYQRLARDILGEREFRPRAERVTIAVPPEQQRFIKELGALVEKAGLEDALWLLGKDTPRMERYLAGESIPTNETCWRMAYRLAEFIADADHVALRKRLVRSAEVARLARVRDRRIARGRRSENTEATE
ncbi:hypothetical protein QWJ26_24375 [Streptomyces sp. CSDS2]|uniref:hypothetical protein n=1 Tax=Streptomyces sp. CSDS2 TaxID=3055051 RepID=UPI0025B02B91|nr:hypothetical protein [Streptomyces sp. CSDS2]MDN3262885.1 hypothetical protein [Streptomyces sp. CSDS2]